MEHMRARQEDLATVYKFKNGRRGWGYYEHVLVISAIHLLAHSKWFMAYGAGEGRVLSLVGHGLYPCPFFSGQHFRWGINQAHTLCQGQRRLDPFQHMLNFFTVSWVDLLKRTSCSDSLSFITVSVECKYISVHLQQCGPLFLILLVIVGVARLFATPAAACGLRRGRSVYL